MNDADRTRLHIAILELLRTKGELGLAEDAIRIHVRHQGYDLTRPQLQAELRMLGDKAWVSSWENDLSAKRWAITSLGERKLAEAGL